MKKLALLALNLTVSYLLLSWWGHQKELKGYWHGYREGYYAASDSMGDRWQALERDELIAKYGYSDSDSIGMQGGE